MTTVDSSVDKTKSLFSQYNKGDNRCLTHHIADIGSVIANPPSKIFWHFADPGFEIEPYSELATQFSSFAIAHYRRIEINPYRPRISTQEDKIGSKDTPIPNWVTFTNLYVLQKPNYEGELFSFDYQRLIDYLKIISSRGCLEPIVIVPPDTGVIRVDWAIIETALIYYLDKKVSIHVIHQPLG